MGILKKHIVLYCPNCGKDIPLKAPRFGYHESRRACFKCGCRFEIISNEGNVTISRLPGFQGTEASIQTEEARVGNVGYWKEHYGDNLLQAHDDFMKKHDAWLAQHGGNKS